MDLVSPTCNYFFLSEMTLALSAISGTLVFETLAVFFLLVDPLSVLVDFVSLAVKTKLQSSFLVVQRRHYLYSWFLLLLFLV